MNMKTKLLKKIRKRFEILKIPNSHSVRLIDHKTYHVVMLWSYTDAIDEILGHYYNQTKVYNRRCRINSLVNYREAIKNLKRV